MVWIPQKQVWTQQPQYPRGLDQSNPLSVLAEVFMPGMDRYRQYGTPIPLHTRDSVMWGGATSSGMVSPDFPLFAQHSGDFTVTFLAVNKGVTRHSVAGYSIGAGAPNYGSLNIVLNQRSDGAYDQQGTPRIDFLPSMSSYVGGVTIGKSYDATNTDHPFYPLGVPVCFSVACLGASASDVSAVTNGRIDTSGITRSGAVPASTKAPSVSNRGFGIGGQYVAATNACTSGPSFCGLVILHRRKLSVDEQIQLTANPWQIFAP